MTFPPITHLVLLAAKRSSFTISNCIKIMSSEALVPSCVFQVLEDPVVDSLASDMLLAARLLCEFSAGGQM